MLDKLDAALQFGTEALNLRAQRQMDGAEIFGLGTPVGARLKDMGQFFAFVVVDMESTRKKWLDFFEKKKRARGDAATP